MWAKPLRKRNKGTKEENKQNNKQNISQLVNENVKRIEKRFITFFSNLYGYRKYIYLEDNQ